MNETNPLLNPDYHRVNRPSVCWTTSNLRVTRLRLLSDHGCDWWDVSYCHGEIVENGQCHQVTVLLPFNQLPKRTWKTAIIEHAKNDNVFAKSLGIIDDINISLLS